MAARWRNVPVPGPHVAALAASLLLRRVHRRPIGGGAAGRVAGAVLAAAGAGLAASATGAAGAVDLERPGRLVTDGPYARSRNPMYVGWSLLQVGWGLLADDAWPLLLLPAVAGTVHRTVLREERRLERRFGAAYRAYAGRVPRYVRSPRGSCRPTLRLGGFRGGRPAAPDHRDAWQRTTRRGLEP